MSQIFKNASIGFLGHDPQDDCIKCELCMNGKTKSYPMIDSSRGSQAARIQLETSLDGTVYATGANTGIGQYTIVLYDGPINKNYNREIDNDSPLYDYFKLDTLADKYATIKLTYVKNRTRSVVARSLAILKGVITNMVVDATSEGDVKCYKVAITINGMWQRC